jgi:transposase-like protein
MCRLKINQVMEVTEHEYILGSMDCMIAHNAVSSPAPVEANALF